MDASIEMKAVALEKVIETQKQLTKMKNNLGIIIEPLDDLIHIASTDDFMAYAKHFEEQILIGDAAPFEKDEITKLKFLFFMHKCMLHGKLIMQLNGRPVLGHRGEHGF